MKKNAFTLIELIAAIGLLGMLATITITISVRKINETKEKARDTMFESIELAAKNYITDNGNELEQFINNDNIYISLQTLVEKEYFTESLVDPTTKKSIPLSNEVYITREENGTITSKYNINQRKEPKLTLIGSYNEFVEVGKGYVELGVIALNSNKEDVSSSVTITGTVDTTTPNIYKITYELDNVKITRNIIVYGGNLSSEEFIPISFENDDWKVILKSVKSGKYPYEVGDKKTIEMDINADGTAEEYTIRVANTTPCEGLSLTSKTACGFVLEFSGVIAAHDMHSGNTNSGGWPASEMRTYVNGTIYNALSEELKDGIIDTYVVSSHGNETITTYENVVDGNFYSIDKLYLLSPQEVYGTSFTSRYDTSNGTSRQLDYYEVNGVSTTNYSGAIKKGGTNVASYWWFRSSDSSYSNSFYSVTDDGGYFVHDATYSFCVSPAFRLAE